MSNLPVIYENLVQANGPEDIYAPLAGNTEEEKLDRVKRPFHYLVKQVAEHFV